MAVINNCWPIRRAPVVIIILLYTLIAIDFAGNWSMICSAFIKNEQNFWTVYLSLTNTHAATWVVDIAASISTILADLYMVCVIPLGIIHNQLTVIMMVDLVLLDDLGAALVCCSASSIFPSFCNWYGVCSHLCSSYS